MCRSRGSSSAFPARLLFLRSLSSGSGAYELGRCPKTRVCPPKCRSTIPPTSSPSESCQRWGEGLQFASGSLSLVPHVPSGLGTEVLPRLLLCLILRACMPLPAASSPWLPKPCARGLFAPSSFGRRAVPRCRREAGKEVNRRSFLALKWL